MTDVISTARTAALRTLHGDLLVVPDAWDAGSAAAMARAGASVIGTTSAGIAWSLGRPGALALTRDELVGAIGRIVAAVDAPVSADVGCGFGRESDYLAATVEAVVAAGAVGIDLEDSHAPGGPPFAVREQAARLRAARVAATHDGLAGLWVNVRTDVFPVAVGAAAGRLDDVLARAVAYRDAGADSLCVPGLVDLPTLRGLTARSPLPINVVAGPGSPSIAELRAAGVRRVSVGPAISQAAYTLAGRATVELFELGTYDAIQGAESFITSTRSLGR